MEPSCSRKFSNANLCVSTVIVASWNEILANLRCASYISSFPVIRTERFCSSGSANTSAIWQISQHPDSSSCRAFLTWKGRRHHCAGSGGSERIKVQKGRFGSQGFKGTKVLSTTWEEKMLKRAKLKELKDLQTEIKARRQAEKDAKRQAREEKEKRRKENELKSSSLERAIRTMSKKQLRNIKKTIVNKQGVVEYVPVYAPVRYVGAHQGATAEV
ncbi:hypothetical protein PHPALM_5768, partial [Phytophthora palmivora]